MPDRRLARALTTVLAACLCWTFVPGTASAATPFPYCSWWLETTPQTANVAFPDAAATYWTTPFKVEPGTSIQVDGTYPDARYMSFNVYDSAFGSFTTNGVSSGLADYLISPSTGSVNPFQATGSPGGAFTVTLTAAAQAGQTNALPLAPSTATDGQLGYLVFRVYLPNGGNSTVTLPKLTLIQNGVSTPLSDCSARTRSEVPKATPSTALDIAERLASRTGSTADGTATTAVRSLAGTTASAPGSTSPCRGSACPPDLRFFRAKASTTNGFFPNVDNAYVSALFRPRSGTVIVVRGKAAASPSGESPVPWPQTDLSLRYWSLCNNIYRKPWPVVANPLPGGKVQYGCAADDATKLDRRGRYAFVVAPESARAAVSAAGGTFIPLSATQPRARQVLIFRNMLPNSTFTHAVQDVAEDGKPSSAATTMGTYYPRAYRCTLAQFVAKSPRCG